MVHRRGGRIGPAPRSEASRLCRLRHLPPPGERAPWVSPPGSMLELAHAPSTNYNAFQNSRRRARERRTSSRCVSDSRSCSPLSPQRKPPSRERPAISTPIRRQPPLLLAFLHDMPKGGDLHNHLDGAIYAEDLLDFAASDNFCVDRTTSRLLGAPCDSCEHYTPKPSHPLRL